MLVNMNLVNINMVNMLVKVVWTSSAFHIMYCEHIDFCAAEFSHKELQKTFSHHQIFAHLTVNPLRPLQ